jgi:hypothetical protein
MLQVWAAMNIDSGTALVLTYLLVNVGIAITCVLAAFAISGLVRNLVSNSAGPDYKA